MAHRIRPLAPLFLAAGLLGCQSPQTTLLPQPIPLSLAGGALGGFATVDGFVAPVPVLIDTGSPLTAYDDLAGMARARVGEFQLFSAEADPVRRLTLAQVPLFITPLRSVGLGSAASPVGALLGGDNLSRFTMRLDYRGTPSLSLSRIDTTCSCLLAESCQAVYHFALAGGQQQIALGENIYSYPPTRVLLDACIEPLADPVRADQPCVDPDGGVTRPYEPSGIDVKLLVATGFPGLALGQTAFDRLRGPGASAALAAQGTTPLHLPDVDDDGPSGAGLPVGVGSLGNATHAALALVSHEVYFGPCAELARSRRQRRMPPNVPPQAGRENEASCLRTRANDDSARICATQASPPEACDDTDPAAPTAAVLEFAGPLSLLVLDDLSPLLQGINGDLRAGPDRPSQAAVEGIIGTTVLERLVFTIDYPNSRLFARCATDDCLTYPRYVQFNECGRDCLSPSAIARAPLAGGLCEKSP